MFLGVSSLLSSFLRYELFRLIQYLCIYANTFPFSIRLLHKIYITSQPSGSSPMLSDYMQVFSKRTEVFITIKEWLTIGGGAQDILDDAQLYSAIWSFLESSSDHSAFKGSMFDAPPVQAWEYLIETKRSVVAAFKSQTMRPMISCHNPRTRNISTRDPPDLDRMDPEAFVDNIDGMASAALSTVTQEVWVSISELLFSVCLRVYSRTSMLPSISSKFKHLIAQAGSYLKMLVHSRSWLRFRRFTPISKRSNLPR
jgi:hypothetical protein